MVVHAHTLLPVRNLIYMCYKKAEFSVIFFQKKVNSNNNNYNRVQNDITATYKQIKKQKFIRKKLLVLVK